MKSQLPLICTLKNCVTICYRFLKISSRFHTICTLYMVVHLLHGRGEDGSIHTWKGYKGSGKPDILEYVKEQTSSVFTDHLTPNNTFEINFMVKFTKPEECALKSHFENMRCRRPRYTDGSKYKYGRELKDAARV